jgi:hypothetical protein
MAVKPMREISNGKPVIVSPETTISEVRDFYHGEDIPGGDLNALSSATRLMLSGGYIGSLAKRARWNDFNSAHSASNLPDCFKRILCL